jgi:hypothetical protein
MADTAVTVELGVERGASRAGALGHGASDFAAPPALQ